MFSRMLMSLRLVVLTATIVISSACSPNAATTRIAPAPATITESSIALPASRGRPVGIRIWAADQPSAIIVFSAGGGGRPDTYSRMLSALARQGFTVIAPVHADALARGDLSGTGGFDSVLSRMEDLTIARGYARSQRADLPLVVMGHSFGSLMSSIAAGAITPLGPQRDADVDGFIAFSSPGVIPGLITPSSFRTLAVPILMVTGDSDVVPRFVTDWRQHRAMYDNSTVPGSALVVVSGAQHELISNADQPRFDALLALTANFIRAVASDRRTARTTFARTTIAGATIERR